MVPPYTADEARDEMIEDMGSEWRTEANRLRDKIELLERYVSDRQLWRLIDPRNEASKAAGLRLQDFYEMLEEYEKTEKTIRQKATKAYQAEMQALKDWEEVARHKDTQGRIMSQLVAYKVEEGLKDTTLDNLVRGRGTAESPIDLTY